jgi:hypothetical protein
VETPENGRVGGRCRLSGGTVVGMMESSVLLSVADEGRNRHASTLRREFH